MSTSQRNTVEGKTIVITGASSGFGRGAAMALAERGAAVVLAARRLDVLNALATEITSHGGRAHAVEVDVSEAQDIARLRDAAISQFGSIDVWVNNVGVGALGFFWDIPIEDHARLIDVNLKGLIFGAHAALEVFRRQGEGVLINIGSVDSELPLAYQSSYAASKAAVLSLSRSLNEELRLAGLDKIKIGTILPWAVDTPWWIHAANYTGHAPRMAAMDDPGIVVDAIVAACTDPHEEQPVGAKARAVGISHHIFPHLTERVSANIFDRESKKAQPAPATSGSLHRPMPEGVTVEGGVRARMKREDADRSA